MMTEKHLLLRTHGHGIYARDFQPEDAYDIHLRPHEGRLYNRNWLAHIQAMNNSNIWTFFFEDKILCFIGFYEKWKGVAKVFVVPSVYARQIPFRYARCVKRHLDDLKGNFGFHRLETESWDTTETNKFMELLGFECEGVLRQYTQDKEDYRMWSMVGGTF